MTKFIIDYDRVLEIISLKCKNYNINFDKFCKILDNYEDNSYKIWEYKDKYFIFCKKDFNVLVLTYYGLFAKDTIVIPVTDYFNLILNNILSFLQGKDLDKMIEKSYNHDRRLFFN